MDSDKIWQMCISEATQAVCHDDVPIGAIIIKDNEIIAKNHNTRQLNSDILGHAEINVIKQASKLLKRWNLSDCDLYVTLKPCSMCNEVIKQSRIRNVYYLLDKLDEKKEYNKTSFWKFGENNNQKNEQMYHEILSDFFKQKRSL